MSKRLSFAIALAAISWAAYFAGVSDAAQPQVPARNYKADEIIVKYRDGVDEYKKELGRFRVRGERKKQFNIVPGLEVIKLNGVSPEDAIEALKNDPDVLYAEPNYLLHLTAPVKLTATPNDPRWGSLWGMTKINAPTAWNTTTGSNQVVVAVIDTGIDYTHPDLAGNMFQNPGDCDGDGEDDDGNGYVDDCHGINVAYGTSDPMDDHYHGTHVAGTIGAVGNNGVGVVGVNWTVKLLACKFFDAQGSATTEGAIECLEYLKNLKTRAVNPVNIVASNNSWGGPENSQALYDAIDEQRQAGILFISGAGNGNAFGIGQNNDSTPFYPCNYFLSNMICVAATTAKDSKAGFSNYGRRTVHVGAPGQAILSTMPGGGYGNLDGTSMATPHVAGLAGLLKAQNMTRDWRVIKNLILAGGDTISSMSNTITGKRINANGSMTCSNSAIQTRVQPVATTISASPGVPVLLASLNINCATPNGTVSVSVSSGGSVTLQDDGAGADQAADDGIYSAIWTPTTTGTFTLTFPGNDRITVNVANPTISVTPSSLDFGSLYVGNSADRNFVVQNSGGGVLVGAATASSPFTIVAGESYNLSAGQSQTVTVRFNPSTASNFVSNVSFTGGSGASRTVSGIAWPLPTFSASPSNIVQGGIVTATWSGIATPTATDWIGLFLPGAPDQHGSIITWRYTTGAASGNVPFTIPATLAPGTYELRLYPNFTYNRIGTSNALTVTLPPPPPQASLSATPSSIGAGGTVTAAWSGITAPTATDWIGLFLPGAPDNQGSIISWRYTTGTASGNVPFTIPATVAPGTYELRLYTNFTYTRIGKSNPLTVTAPPQANLSASPSSVVQGGIVTATWSGITAPTATDWIGLYVPGTPDHYTGNLAWRYTTGAASGNVPFTIPATIAPGTYELRLYTNFTYTRIGTSNTFTVTAPAPPPQASLSVNPTSVTAGGTVTATWSGITAPTATDWIGLYVPGTPDHYTGNLAWRYTTGAANGNVPFTIPATIAPGIYELRLYTNFTYTRIGTSNPFVVNAP